MQRTHVEDPSESYGFDDTAMRETLDPESQGEASPSSDTIPRSFPEENGDCTSSNPGDCGGEDEHASKCLRWWVDCRQDTELEDENEAC